MRRTLLTLMAATSLMIAAGLVNAQTETAKRPEPATAVEKFMARRGRLIIKDFYEVGTIRSNLVGQLDVKLLVLSAPGATAAEKVFGVKFERPAVERYESEGASFLDFDETTAALDALVFMRNLGAKMAGEDHEYTEAIYETRGGMQIGFFQTDRKQTAFVEVGGPIGGKPVFMDMDGLSDLENFLRQAVARLKDMGAK